MWQSNLELLPFCKPVLLSTKHRAGKPQGHGTVKWNVLVDSFFNTIQEGLVKLWFLHTSKNPQIAFCNEGHMPMKYLHWSKKISPSGSSEEVCVSVSVCFLSPSLSLPPPLFISVCVFCWQHFLAGTRKSSFYSMVFSTLTEMFWKASFLQLCNSKLSSIFPTHTKENLYSTFWIKK